ncbi:TIGR03087 family PEP-CTERM/XrtA system glycosyltransferase [Rheinheimera maricola]|uniref:TIGR03087 family PEP-CTERM/XrtA system glycosyltransferase n=1 Tax=Rheinheimera maricola TaxID=2793282 RepID=A0ABS7X8Q4_9GAMM|nr:TIGR03087 family PEP-CTERM/XrtA system glycosyltransferase [Rheinheimera maricola]MBZ9611721.1 TIGR03087 family PEP-CTERM/XrtA system glycosyltransferase [Rheinheimera maricola]
MSHAKPALLLLVHRIPYPPNKGDKIRSFNLMKALSAQYDIHLGCFIDDPFDQQYIPTLSQWCKTVFCINLNKWRAKLAGLSGFISNNAITLPYYYHAALASWVKQTVQAQHIQHVLVYSSSMAQYVDTTTYQQLIRVIDFVDIDSDKWRQYADKSTGIKRWFYQREARLLQQYETRVCQRFNASLFVSDDEASAFRCLVSPALHNRVHSVLNGVDTDFFSPTASFDAVNLPSHYIVFTGAMDYWANVDAVCWFCQNIWPSLKQRYPELHFLIVGGKPSSEVRALAQQLGVVVSGRVNDIRPYIAKARFAVAPMLIARGIQNKVLEAMSMNKAVVCSAMAMEGINAPLSPGAIVADGTEHFIQACITLLQQPLQHCDNRQWIIDNFTWQQTLTALPQFISGDSAI